VDFKELLREKGLKVTPQRLAILERLEERGHLSVEELFEILQLQFPTLSLATVYKNLHLLSERGVIAELPIRNRHKFEIEKGPHSHFVCEKCGKVVDLPVTPNLSTQVEEEFPGYRWELYLYGLCEECRGKGV
jgi:Fe2+ or Zn2+ uptake regulation protein